MCLNWVAIIGLILNVIGSFILMFDSNRLSRIVSNIVRVMAQDHGKMDSHRFTDNEKHELYVAIGESKNRQRFGTSLLIAGFVLQLFSEFF